jgi:hypothetical protein
MIKIPKFKPTIWWGFETLEAECNCDLDNIEIKNKQIFKSEKERDKVLNKWFENSPYCIKQYTKFCTTVNEQDDNKRKY